MGENRCNGCNEISVKLKIRKLFQRLILIRVNVVDNNVGPEVNVPLYWIVDSKQYHLRMIVFHDVEREHFSSLMARGGRWYSSQRDSENIRRETFLRYMGVIEGEEWNGNLGHWGNAKIFLVIYSRRGGEV